MPMQCYCNRCCSITAQALQLIYKGEEILPVIESEEDLFRVTDAAIQFFDDNANPSERFRFTIERVGEDKFIEKMKEAYHG